MTPTNEATGVAEEENDEPSIEETHPHVYQTVAHSFSLQLQGGTVQAKDGLLRLTHEQEQEVRRLMKSGRADIIQAIRKLDLNAAAVKAQEALAAMGRKSSAIRGTVSSTDSPLTKAKQELLANGQQAGGKPGILGQIGGNGSAK